MATDEHKDEKIAPQRDKDTKTQRDKDIKPLKVDNNNITLACYKAAFQRRSHHAILRMLSKLCLLCKERISGCKKKNLKGGLSLFEWREKSIGGH